jgi:hypothetical protein
MFRPHQHIPQTESFFGGWKCTAGHGHVNHTAYSGESNCLHSPTYPHLPKTGFHATTPSLNRPLCHHRRPNLTMASHSSRLVSRLSLVLQKCPRGVRNFLTHGVGSMNRELGGVVAVWRDLVVRGHAARVGMIDRRCRQPMPHDPAYLCSTQVTRGTETGNVASTTAAIGCLIIDGGADAQRGKMRANG